MDQAPLCLQVSLVHFMTRHFRDKLEATTTPDQLAFLESYGRHMVARCCLVPPGLYLGVPGTGRRECKGLGTRCTGEGWEVRHIRTHHGAPVEVAGRSGRNPTFWEFVQWIIRGGEAQAVFSRISLV